MLLSIVSLMLVALVIGKRSPAIDADRFDPRDRRIRCPLCQWQPQKQDRWYCDPGCHHHWNTFDTAGICPQCAKHWERTACLRCHQWSAHEAWYE